jgi:hypothetical protein
VLFYIHTDACTDVYVGMGIGILILEAMISKLTIEKLASVDDKVAPIKKECALCDKREHS